MSSRSSSGSGDVGVDDHEDYDGFFEDLAPFASLLFSSIFFHKIFKVTLKSRVLFEGNLFDPFYEIKQKAQGDQKNFQNHHQQEQSLALFSSQAKLLPRKVSNKIFADSGGSTTRYKPKSIL